MIDCVLPVLLDIIQNPCLANKQGITLYFSDDICRMDPAILTTVGDHRSKIWQSNLCSYNIENIKLTKV